MRRISKLGHDDEDAQAVTGGIDGLRNELWFGLSKHIESYLSDANVHQRDKDNYLRVLWRRLRDDLFVCGAPERHSIRNQNDCQPWADVFNRLTGLLGKGCIVGLLGPRGTGKTQLCAWLCRYWIERNLDVTRSRMFASPRYETAMGIFLELRATFRPGEVETEQSVLERLCESPLLVIDEAQERGETDWENTRLTYIIDQRYQRKLDSILVSNLTPSEFSRSVGPSIASRLNEVGGIIECAWPSFRTARTA